MKKRILALCSLLLCLAGCKGTEEQFNNNQQRDWRTRFDFDGKYKQNKSGTWPIAFDSYSIKDSYCFLYGRLVDINQDRDQYGIEEMENHLNQKDPCHLCSDPDETSGIAVLADENTLWDITSFNEDGSYSFTITIDVSPIKEKNGRLNLFDTSDEFGVFHYFRQDEENL
jgi:hypothetical protein